MIQIYLAGPYTSSDEKVMNERFRKLTKMAGRIMKLGYNVYSPITHGHTIVQYTKLQLSHDFWMKQCKPFLMCCEVLAIYTMSGFSESSGVSEELRFARENGIKIIMFGSLYEFKREIENL